MNFFKLLICCIATLCFLAPAQALVPAQPPAAESTDDAARHSCANQNGLANKHGDGLQDHDAGGTAMRYDDNGNLTSQTDAKGQTTAYQYDAFNRIASITYADGSVTAFDYDQAASGLGRLIRILDASGAIEYDYDADGRLISERRTIDGARYTTGYGYDAAGRLATLAYPSGQVIVYGRDMAGRIERIATGMSGATVVLADQIRYQALGAIASYVNGAGQAIVRDAELDSRQRPPGDDAGPTTKGDAEIGKLLQGSAAQDRTAARDAGGSAVNKQFAYDARGRLVGVNTALGAVEFRFNALGQRVQKLTPKGGTVFHYDSGGRLIAESDGQSWKEYVYLGGMPIAVLAR